MYSLYVVKDIIADKCGPIFQAENDLVALRAFKKLLSKIPFEDHNEFICLRIGNYNDDTGEITGENVKEVQPELNLLEMEDVIDG